MNWTEMKNRNDKITPPSSGYFKGFEPDPPRRQEPMKMILRTTNYDFIVDWQMNEKNEDKQPG